MASRAPFSLSCPRCASGPLSGATWPILTTVAALAGTGAEAAASDAADATTAGALAEAVADASGTADAPAAGSLSLFLLHAVAIAPAVAMVTKKPNLIRIQ